MKMLRFISLILIVNSIWNNHVSAQNTQEGVKASLIYYFAGYITWPNESQITEFQIGILSRNNLITKELQLLSKSKTIKGKPFQIKQISISDTVYNTHILYADASMNESMLDIYRRVTSKNILLITDNCPDRLLTMLNFINNTKESRVTYEANRQNLKLEGFEYKNELLVYGGSQIDVKELLDEADQKLKDVLDRIKLAEVTMKNAEAVLTDKNNTILNLTSQLFDYQEKINLLDAQYKKYSQMVDEKENLIKDQSQKLKYQQDQKNQVIQEINQKQLELKKAQLALNTLKIVAERKEIKIREQNEVLREQGSIVKLQQRALLFFLIAVVAILIAAIAILRLYRIKRNQSLELEIKVNERTKELQASQAELEKHKDHLEDLVHERTNEITQLVEELQTSNEELFSTNEVLFENKKSLEEALEKVKQTQEKLIQSEKLASLGMLTAGLAHEINNPINFIETSRQLLSSIAEKITTQLDPSNSDNELILHQLKIIDKSIKTGVTRVTDIVESLRNYLRQENDVFVACNLKEQMQDALLILKNTYKYNIDIIENYNTDELVECIPGKICQVFVNILSNAIDAIKREGKIYIEIGEQPNSLISISIRDTGEGMDKTTLSQIYDPFFTTKEVGKGTGLGLYITYGIIQQHNGIIEIDSIPGEGSCFIIKLPIKHTITD